jgi:hypothetical protein
MDILKRLDHEMELLKAEVKMYTESYDSIMDVIDPNSVTGCCAECKRPATKWTSYDHPSGWRVKGLKGKQWMYCYKIPRER